MQQIIWVKSTNNNYIFKSNGHWLQHSKEICLVGSKVCTNELIFLL